MANGNSYVLCLMAPFSVTPNYLKPPHFEHFVSPFDFHVFVVELQTSNMTGRSIIASAIPLIVNYQVT